MRRKGLILLVLLLLILLGGVTAYWWIAADRLGEGIARWQDEARAEGVTADFAPPSFGGWPLRLTARFEAPLLGLPAGQRWQGPAEVTGYAWLWDPQRLHVTAPGRHLLTLPPGQLALEAEAADATVIFSRGLIDAVSLSLRQAVLSPPGAEQSLSAASLALSVSALTPVEGNRYATDFSLDLQEAPLPPAAQGVVALLGPTLDHLLLAGELRGALGGRDPRGAAAIWRDSGGVVDLERIELTWGNLVVRGSGTITLDEAFRPLGAFSFETAGLPELVQRLAQAGILDQDRALALSLGLGALSTGRDEAGRTLVKLPLTLQGGTLSLGMIPLASLPPLF